MDNLQYSRPIDVHRISDYPEVQRMISYLLSELKDAGLIKGSPRDKVLRHLKVVVLDLYVAYMRDPLVYVGYPRGSDAYAQGTRLRKLYLGRDSMKKIVDSLFSLGYFFWSITVVSRIELRVLVISLGCGLLLVLFP